MSRFKKENKELLTYLLFESYDEEFYIQGLKDIMDLQFQEINIKSYYFIKKSLRKILREIKKHIRYSKNKETEIELLLYFCKKLSLFKPSMNNSIAIKNIYDRQIITIRKSLKELEDDLQYDFRLELEKLS